MLAKDQPHSGAAASNGGAARPPASIDFPTLDGLPPLAGLCTPEQAMAPGLTVAESVQRLKREHYLLRRLAECWLARLTAEPVYELKMAYSLHAHLATEHAGAIRSRVAEMRTPPLGLEEVPHPALERLLDETRSAPDTPALLRAVYQVVLPALIDCMRRHREDTHALADQPTRRLLRFALLELEEALDYGHRAVECLAAAEPAAATDDWLQLLRDCITAAGGIDGTGETSDLAPPRRHSRQPLALEKSPRRDDRFPDPYNMGVHAEQFLNDPGFAERDKVLMMYYKRLREIDVPEMMATILIESPDKPFGFHRDMTRQLWDEARHAMMGEVGFRSLGIDWPRFVMVNFTWSKGLNEQLTARERHAVLYFIEQGLMTRTGKRFEWELGRDSGDRLAELFQDFDWADEVLHARIGRDWYTSGFESQKDAIDYGSECWDKVLINWDQWKAEGLTEHRNWWPDLYREASRLRGETPDPKTLAFSTTYEQTRADLKAIAANA